MITLINRKPIFNINRCCQCGACIAVCKHHAISALFSDVSGLNEIVINPYLCVECGKCSSVCPSGALPKMGISDYIFSKIKNLFLAYASDEKIRKKSSSGGITRLIASQAIKNDLVDAVYSLKKTTTFPWAEGHLWTDVFDPGELANSMYLPILSLKKFKNIKEERILVIGTTCQLFAISKMPEMKGKKFLKIGILCKQQKNFKMTRFISKLMDSNVDFNSVKNVSYRGCGWPGKITIGERTINFSDIASLPYKKRLWRVPACRYCPDPFGFVPDLTVADPWGIDNGNSIGKTMVAVWTETGALMIEKTEGIKIDRYIELPDFKRSILWDDLLFRQKLVRYYAGKITEGNISFFAKAEMLQSKFFEWILEKKSIPKFLLKILTHLPDLGRHFRM